MGVIVPCEVLTGNAFGQRDFRLCCIYHTRGLLIVITVLVTILTAILLFQEKILISLGQNPEVAKYCTEFCIYGLPGIFFDLIFQY